MELDLICQRAPTAERYKLLGSACKRLAWMHTHRRPRNEALINMANYYRLATEAELKSGRPARAYAFSNRALAEVLAAMLNKADMPGDDWLAECESMIARTQESNERNTNLWDALGEPDCMLVRMLARPARRGVRDDADHIARSYQRVLMRGASPRERASVVEHVEFVVALCANEGKALREALAVIRAAL